MRCSRTTHRKIDQQVDTIDAAYEDLLSVAAAFRETVRGKGAGVVDGQRSQRHRAVRHHRVGIDEDAPLAVWRLLHVEHRLILQSCVVGEEVVTPTVGWDAGAGEVVEGREAFDERITPRSVECVSRQAVLSLDPRDGFGRIWVFEPAYGSATRTP
jgi:hypothetical protein